jgi:hypothetical protein
VKDYPALDVRAESADLLLAAVDEFAPTAVEERGDIVRLFFPTAAIRNAARAALTGSTTQPQSRSPTRTGPDVRRRTFRQSKSAG